MENLCNFIVRKFDKMCSNRVVKKDLVDDYVIRRFGVIYKDSVAQRVFVTQLYKDIANKEMNLQINRKMIKKGKEKYEIIICKDYGLQTVFSLKRHGSDGEIKEIQPSNRTFN